MAGSYTAKIDVKGISTFTSGTSYWSFRNNTSGNRMLVSKLFLMSEFVGTAASSLCMFAVFRFSGGTPSGGNAITSVKLDTNSDNTNLLDCRFAAAGLTMTGVTVESNPIFITSTINQLVSTQIFTPFDFNSNNANGLMLNTGEGIVIQAFNTLVAGIGLHGVVLWSEGI